MSTLIAIPCMDTLPVLTSNSLLNLRKTEGARYATLQNSLIYDSRNAIAAKAIASYQNEESEDNPHYDKVLWIDSDMTFDPDAMIRLTEDIDSGLDYVCGLCFVRKLPTYPVVYSDLKYFTDDQGPHATVTKMYDYPQDALFRIAASGFGMVMTTTKLLRDVWEHYGPPFDPMSHMGEDISFCWRVNQLGLEMYCDSRVKVGHVGLFTFDESVYTSQRKAADAAALTAQDPDRTPEGRKQ